MGSLSSLGSRLGWPRRGAFVWGCPVSGSPYLILETIGATQVPLSDPTTFGRASDNTVPLKDVSVSTHHAVIRKDGAFWVVEDLGSTNGTWLNHTRVDGRAVIKEGDQIQMGSQMIRVGGFRGSGDRRTAEAAAICPRCEKPLPGGAAFCPGCGVPLRLPTTPPVPTTSTAPFPMPTPVGFSPAQKQRLLLGCLAAGVVVLVLGLLAGWWLWNDLRNRLPERPGAAARL